MFWRFAYLRTAVTPLKASALKKHAIFFFRSRYKSICFGNKDEHASLNYSKNRRAVKTLASLTNYSKVVTFFRGSLTEMGV